MCPIEVANGDQLSQLSTRFCKNHSNFFEYEVPPANTIKNSAVQKKKKKKVDTQNIKLDFSVKINSLNFVEIYMV